MSKVFNSDINNIKSKIREQCILYRSNYREFAELIETIKSRNEFNSTDVEQSKQILSSMNNGEVKIIFCGQVKSGKTRCVMEFLSGSIQLPSKDIPATAYFTNLFYSDPHVMFSQDSTGDREYHEFDGKVVDEDLVGKRKNFMVDEKNLDLIFHVGISDQSLKDSVIVIDTPGLNETQGLDDAFKINLKKINPQIVVYIFNYGPGFIDSDAIYYSTVIGNLRIDLRKIFIFNKFDEAFKESKIFMSGDDSDESDCESDHDDCSSEDEDETHNFEGLYKNEYEKHKRRLDESHCTQECPCLIGYSAKYTYLHRCKKEKRLIEFRKKHTDLLNHLRCNINSMDLDVLKSMLRLTTQFLFSEFQTIFCQILSSDNTVQRHNLLSDANKNKILATYDSSHETLLNINISQIPDLNFDGAISQIVKNQDRIQTEFLKTKFSNIINSLSKFFIDRYVNYFSNIILTKLEEISFDKLNDELRSKGIDSLFSHTFCSLANGTEKIETVVKSYFDNDSNRILSSGATKDEHEFKTSEACTFYIKSNFRFQKDLVWDQVNEFIQTLLQAERQSLEKAIEDKKRNIITDFKMSKEQTNVMIKTSLFLLMKWLTFNNNYMAELSTSEFYSKPKMDFLRKIIISSSLTKEEINLSATSLNMVFKSEYININDLSYDNCVLIKYLLRCQYISNDTCPINYYYKDNEQCLYFLTDLQNLIPLRLFLTEGVTSNEKDEIINQLIKLTLSCYEQNLPIDNFGPDMIFCRRLDSVVVIKLGEAIHKFDEWQYTLATGSLSDTLLHKYPIKCPTDQLPCMSYALCWTILIILHGSCENICPVDLNKANFEREIEARFQREGKNKIYIECCKIIKMSFQKSMKMDEIISALENMKK